MSQRRRPSGQPSAPRSSREPGRSSAGRQPAKSNQPRVARGQGSAGDFWGRAVDAAPAVQRIRPTPDPAAIPRSLGDPPLGPNPVAAQHHLAAVYEEAVRAATALAAANGLFETDEA